MNKKFLPFILLSLFVFSASSLFAAKVNFVKSATGDGTYHHPAHRIDINVVFDEPIQVTGNPDLFLNTGGAFPFAVFVGVRDNVMVFQYTVQHTDLVNDLNYNSLFGLSLRGGSIKDLNGQDADLMLPLFTSPNSLGNMSEVDLFGAPPFIQITGPNPLRTNSSFHTVSGTAVFAGSLIRVFVNKGLVASIPSGPEPNRIWSVDLANRFIEGVNEVVVSEIESKHGLISQQSNVRTFVFDTTPPLAPTITSPANNAVFFDNTPVITGTAEPNSTVEVFVDGVSVGNTTADATGAWTLVPSVPLAEGDRAITAQASDDLGNTGPLSDVTNITIDRTAPAQPQITQPISGTITSDNMPQIRGTAEPNSLVEVFADGVLIGRARTTAGGDWTLNTSTPLADGTRNITARAQDRAGNVGPLSDPTVLIIDTTGPNAPDITSPTNNLETMDTTPTVAGTAEPNSTVSVFIDGVKIGETQADANGNWTLTPTIPLAEGARRITAQARDDQGNVGPLSPVTTVIIDLTSPGITIIDQPTAGPTSDPTPTISGRTDPNVIVDVFVDGVKIGEAPTDANGNWTFTPTTPLADGPRAITAQARDTAGNTGPVSDPANIIVDTTAPAQATITAPANNQPTSNNKPTITGTAEPNSTVDVFVDGVKIGETQADANGNWTLVPLLPLGDGSRNITAQARDDAGNTGPLSDVTTILVDTTGPTLTLTAPAAGPTNDSTPLISGNTEPNSKVEVFVDGVKIGETQADANGNWDFTPTTPLAEGPRAITAQAEDTNGNKGPLSDVRTITVDTIAPGVTTIDSPLSGPLNNATPTISGRTDPNTTVDVFVDGVKIGETQSDPNGNWSFTPTTPLADGDRAITAQARDDAGNTGPLSSPTNVTIDTAGPGVTTIDAPASGPLNDATPTISGRTDPNATVDVFVDGVKVGETQADANGNWNFTPTTPLSEGPHAITAQARDGANNTGPLSAPTNVVVDTTAPGKATISSPTNNETTSDNTPRIEGTAEPNSTVDVFVDGVKIGETQADGNGNWSFTPTAPLADGPRAITAQARDDAGNTGPLSDVTNVIVDTAGPGVTTITAPPAGPLMDTTPTITGNTTPNSTADVFVDGVKVGETQADASGNWSFTPTTPLTEGPHAITAQARDGANNTGPLSDPTNVIVDTTAPPVVTIDNPLDNSTINTNTPTIRGKAENNSTVEIFVDGVKVGETKADNNGNWSFVPAPPLAEGDRDITAQARDDAGNVGPRSDVTDVTVDTSGPGITTVEMPLDGLTTDNTPLISGKTTPNTTVDVFVDGNKIGETQSDANGNWSLTPTTPLTEGPHAITAQARDGANNTGPISNTRNIIVDTIAPNPPLVNTPADPEVDGEAPITGTSEPGTTVEVFVDGKKIGETQTDNNGNWSLTPSPRLEDGPHEITAFATDEAGNKSGVSNTVNIVVKNPVTVPPVANLAPTVFAGPNQTINFPQVAELNGVASDDGLPVGALLITEWVKTDGPGTVTFSDPSVLNPKVQFSEPGTYVLTLRANDGQAQTQSQVIIVVNAPSEILNVTDFNNSFNPKNQQVTIPYTLAQSGQVEITVYDHFGDQVKALENSTRPVGTHQVTWNGSNDVSNTIGSGVYIVVFKLDGQVTGTRKIIAAR